MKNKKGLYIHIPFCCHVCNYCDFFKMVASSSYQDKYIEYLLRDLKLNYKGVVDTIYIGGGTPSSLSLDNLTKLLWGIDSLIGESNILEYTFEVNPEDINLELILLLKKFGINRLSIGVQTFNNRLQKILNRYSDYDDIKRKIDMLKKHGFNNINLDLMYGISDETLEEMLEDLNKIISLKPQHISTYSLILEEKTILYHQYLKGKYSLSDDDVESLMYDKIMETLKKAGYNHYETSNFAIADYESIHNNIYWSNGEYLGIGAGSSGYLDGVRYKNTTRINDYYRGIDESKMVYAEQIILTEDDKKQEEVMLGLRKIKGINTEVFFQKFGFLVEDCFPNINELLEQGFLEKDNQYLRIKEEKQYISNAILSKIFM